MHQANAQKVLDILIKMTDYNRDDYKEDVNIY